MSIEEDGLRNVAKVFQMLKAELNKSSELHWHRPRTEDLLFGEPKVVTISM